MANLTLTLSQALSSAFSAYNMGKLVEAEQLCQQIINAKPDLFDALHLLGVVQSRLGKKDTALTSYDRALALRPDYAEALSNRGVTLHELNRFQEALASYDRALALRPDFPEALCNRGNTLKELKRFEEALASYDRALALRPDYAEALYNEALCRLLISDFGRGWEQHEWRWETEQLRSGKRNFSQPQWTGQKNIAAETILLHAEQGVWRHDPVLPLRAIGRRARWARNSGGAKATARADEHSRRCGANRVQGRPATRFRYPLPIAQPTAGVRDAARDDTIADALFARLPTGGDRLERAVGTQESSQDRPRMVWPIDAQERS
jgi:tetratricopeptide (TPR) repeat protein